MNRLQVEALPNAARIQRVDGEVAFNNAAYTTDANSQANTQWVAATANQPFSVGDRIYTRENSHASLAFTGRNFARLYPNTELDVLDLSNGRTQLSCATVRRSSTWAIWRRENLTSWNTVWRSRLHGAGALQRWL